MQIDSAYALCRIAKYPGLYERICDCNGITALLELVDTNVEDLPSCAAYLLYEFSLHMCTLVEMIKKGAVEKLGKLVMIDKRFQDCRRRTVERMKNNLTKRIIERLSIILFLPDHLKNKINIVYGISIIGSPETFNQICACCLENDVLINLLELLSTKDKKLKMRASLALSTKDKKLKMRASLALSLIAQNSTSSANGGQQQNNMDSVVTTGQDSNNTRNCDLTFILKGQCYPANKKILMAESEVFRAMLAGGFKETYCKEIRITNISYDVFVVFLRLTALFIPGQLK